MCRGGEIIVYSRPGMGKRKEDPEVAKSNRVGASLQLLYRCPAFVRMHKECYISIRIRFRENRKCRSDQKAKRNRKTEA
jgi:hypothetical protein